MWECTRVCVARPRAAGGVASDYQAQGQAARGAGRRGRRRGAPGRRRGPRRPAPPTGEGRVEAERTWTNTSRDATEAGVSSTLQVAEHG